MENISLFGKTMCEKSQDKDLFSGGPLDVVRMEFVEAETLRWEDLFSGFDSLCHRVCLSTGRYVRRC